MVTVNKNEFIKLYNEEGTSTAITVKGDKVNELVLIQDIQLDSVSDYVLHVDFHAVKSDEKVTADIPVVLQ
jgi:large subunit ribosomal protein L25